MEIQIKRAYDKPARSDGHRVLVDRVWPRGVTKQALCVDEWLKEVAPSTELRQWFGHEAVKWEEFQRRYFSELEAQPEAIRQLATIARKVRLTLVFAARDTEHNNAVALKNYLYRKRG